jgi:hypothetical protein
MKLLASQDTRERHEFLDVTIQEAQANLANPDVTRGMAEHILSRTVAIADSLYVPNVKNGVVSAPRQYRGSGAVPIVAARVGEDLRFDTSFLDFHPIQSRIVHDGFLSYFEGDETKARITTDYIEELLHKDELELTIPKTATGVVTGAAVSRSFKMYDHETMGENPEKIVWGRPLVSLVIPSSDKAVDPVLVHELQHVDQRAHRPIFDSIDSESNHYCDELEAYHAGAAYSIGLVAVGKRDIDEPSKDIVVEALRRQHADPTNPFTITPELKEAFDENGLRMWF